MSLPWVGRAASALPASTHVRTSKAKHTLSLFGGGWGGAQKETSGYKTEAGKEGCSILSVSRFDRYSLPHKGFVRITLEKWTTSEEILCK